MSGWRGLAVFSRTADVLVVGDDAGVVQILDATNGNVLSTFEYGVPIWDVNIRTDGKLLAVARDDGKISVIDLTTRKESYNLQMNGQLVESAFSPNGTWIAAGSNAARICRIVPSIELRYEPMPMTA